MISDKDLKNSTILSEKIAKERYSATRVITDSSWHKHDFYEFTICTSGKCANWYDFDAELSTNKGFVVLLRPNEFHKIEKKSEDFAHDDVYISTEKMQKICNAFSGDLYDKISDIKGPVYCVMDFDKLKQVQDVVLKLSNVTERNTENDAEHSFLVAELLKLMFEKYVVKKEAALPDWLEEIRQKISNPENFILPLGDLLEDSFYSRAYISVAFKKYTGETVVEYRNRIRVKYSVSMLSENYMSINRIAGLLGWDNPNNYIIAFKKVYGVTPLQYKNSRLKNE